MERSTTSRLLLVSPHPQDYVWLRSILPPSLWVLDKVETVHESQSFLQSHTSIALVICEETLYDGDWKDVLSLAEQVVIPPAFVVSSRFTDNRLWAEALNLGAFDVLLAAPYDADEVLIVTESARVHWSRRYEASSLQREDVKVASAGARTHAISAGGI